MHTWGLDDWLMAVSIVCRFVAWFGHHVGEKVQIG